MSQSTDFVRNQLLVDTGVQAALLRRVIVYAMAALVYFLTILVIEETLLYEDRHATDVLRHTLDESIYWLPGLLMLGPLMVYDMLCLTNRFAGPMYSLRRELRRLADNESQRPLRFRDGDYWNDMAQSFNEIREELQRYRDGVSEPDSGMKLQDYGDVTPQNKLFEDDEDDGEDDFSSLDMSEVIDATKPVVSTA